MLQVFAEVASSKLGPYDLIGRLGGEEFAIVLTDTGREEALAVAERIRLAFEHAAANIDGRRFGGTVSIGMVAAEPGFIDVPALLGRADEALYCAKERGRNRVEIAQLKPAPDRARDLAESASPSRAAVQSAA